MKAAEVQQMLGVLDKEIILSGLLIDFTAIDIWFEDGKVVCRRIKRGADPGIDPVERIAHEDFQLDLLVVNLKCAYRKLTNPKLVDLTRTFGRSCCNAIPLRELATLRE